MALADFPQSYKDPQYAALDAATEKRLELPPGMVQAIRTVGERTNADRVSSAGARTPYQITGATRKAVLEKYGIDAYLSPANASEAAGLLLQESLKRNEDDPESAVREYHGGTNQANWGKQNDAYWARVGPALETSKIQALSGKFSQWMKANPAEPAPTAPAPADPVASALQDRFTAWKAGGDMPPSAIAPENRQPVSAVMPQATPTPEPGMIDKAIGTGEAALTTATGLTGGLAGMIGGTAAGVASSILDGSFGTQAGVQSAEQTAAAGANALTYQPRTPSGQSQAGVVGDAMQALLPVAPILHTLPPVMDAVRPVAGMARDTAASVMDRAATAAPQALRDVGAKVAGVFRQAPADPAAPVAPATPPAVTQLPAEQIAGIARRAGGGNESAMNVLAEQANPDPSIVKSAQRLGVENDLQPDHVTASESFRQVVSALKSINPNSALSLAERDGLGRVAERAGNLVDEIGGTRDLSALDSTIRNRMTDTVASMGKQADALYKKLRDQIPAKTPAPADNVLGFIAQRADELGGGTNLSSLEKQIVAKLTPVTKTMQPKGTGAQIVGQDGQPLTPAPAPRVTVKQPTYTLLDDVRKDVGAAARMQGPFKDADTGLAKKLYSLLTDDQEKVATQAGLGDVWSAAKNVVAARKGVEDSLTELFGKALDRTFVGGGQVGLAGAISGLAKGDSARLTRLLAAVPDDLRQSVVASGLGTAFRKASTRGDMVDFTGYAKWYEGLRTNRQAYAAVMSNLPLTARKQLAALYNVSKGVSDSLNRRVKTGAINTIKEELLGKDTLVQKLYDAAKGSAVGATVGTAVGAVAGPGIGGAVASILTKAKPKSMAAVDELITSPEFAQLVRTTAGTAAEKAAVKKVAASPRFITVIKTATGKIPSLGEREQWILENMRPVPIQQQDRHPAAPTIH